MKCPTDNSLNLKYLFFSSLMSSMPLISKFHFDPLAYYQKIVIINDSFTDM